jgi:hypothetical protein
MYLLCAVLYVIISIHYIKYKIALANKDKVAKKRALWYFMAPAYWILKER